MNRAAARKWLEVVRFGLFHQFRRRSLWIAFAMDPEGLNMELEIRGLSKTYASGARALDGVDLKDVYFSVMAGHHGRAMAAAGGGPSLRGPGASTPASGVLP